MFASTRRIVSVGLKIANLTERSSKILAVMKFIMQGILTMYKNGKPKSSTPQAVMAGGCTESRIYTPLDLKPLSSFNGIGNGIDIGASTSRPLTAVHHGSAWCSPLTMVQHGAVGIVDKMADRA